MFQFSIPMPNNLELIDKLIDINSKIKKSKITSLYFALGPNCEEYTGFEQNRTLINSKPLLLKDWMEIAEYSINKGFKVIYLLNAIKSCDLGSEFRKMQFEKIKNLISKLNNIGCNTYRVCDFELITHLSENYRNIELYASTSHEYHNIKQYQNYVKIFPQVKQFIPSLDSNRNFMLLRNLKKQFPNIELELIANEGCLHNCPFRYNHHASIPSGYLNQETMQLLNELCKTQPCAEIYHKDLIYELFKANTIMPWDLDEYKKIGIKNFKLVGRNALGYENGSIFDEYYLYLKGIDNYKDIENENFAKLSIYSTHINKINFTIKEIKPYLPKIEHFIKKGHLCASTCKVECNYCRECANKFKKYLEKKNK